MRMLIADDDSTSRAMLAGVLKKGGHEVVETTDGAEALAALEGEEAPALAILDWVMPKVAGLEVIKRIRARPDGGRYYLLMLTSRSDKSDLVAGLEAGANDYLAKPFDAGELKARVEVGRRMVEMQEELKERSAEMTRLHRIFYHDIMNAAVGLRGLGEPQAMAGPDEAPRIQAMIRDLAGKMIEEIQSQRDLAQAENGELATKPTELDAADVLGEAVDTCRGIAASAGVEIESVGAKGIHFTSDRTLLRRVLCNMIKNAVEASRPGDWVRVGCREEGDRIAFAVRNAAAMPAEVQARMFRRSFSTKGDGRGIGTYSIKLLTEKYLKGEVTFVSGEGGGTEFTASYPRRPTGGSGTK